METTNKNLISKTLARRMMVCIEEYDACRYFFSSWQSKNKVGST